MHDGGDTDAEVLGFIDRHALYGRGVGYVDAHLLAAPRPTAEAKLWTNDRKLRAVADALSLATSGEANRDGDAQLNLPKLGANRAKSLFPKARVPRG